MINFDFQGRVEAAVGSQFDTAALDKVFADYAKLQAGRPAQMLNYI